MKSGVQPEYSLFYLRRDACLNAMKSGVQRGKSTNTKKEASCLNAMKSGVQQVRAVEFYEDLIMSECDEERSATL